jgi:FAD/FMN-containing dehydrogenase
MRDKPTPHATSRRDFLRAGALAALLPVLPAAHRPAARPAAARRRSIVVNDIHSRLNPTRIERLLQPASIDELRGAVRDAAVARAPISVAGGRHAMGGQQFATDSRLIDTRGLRAVLDFDPAAGVVEVEAGIQWPELVAWLERQQADSVPAWGIVQKQTGADRLSLGGALSANVHGRGLRYRPIIQDVESFVLVGPDGEALTCSRRQNSELFGLAIGGYGLFGPIASVRLRLARRHKVERVVEVIDVDQLAAAFDDRIAAGFEFGDFQFATAATDAAFMRQGVFSCYRPASDDAPIEADQAMLSAEDWMRLGYLAHVDPRRAFEIYAAHYLRTSGQTYWSDLHQMSYYRDDYHVALSQQLGAAHPGSEMITEIYVPRAALAAFMTAARAELRQGEAPLIYGTIRLIERDDESYLAWARQPWACIIFNLHVDHTAAGRAAAANAFRRLIDIALQHAGSYYLTYHRWAHRDQVEAAHPQMTGFLRRKRAYDPEERFQSDWYRHYRHMFAGTLAG